MANLDRVAKLAEYLRTVPDAAFNQASWGPALVLCDSGLPAFKEDVLNCRTPACMAGHAIVCFEKEASGVYLAGCGVTGIEQIYNMAMEILELTTDEADHIFAPSLHVNLRKVRKSEAIITLEHFAKTGEIDWSINEGLEYATLQRHQT